jgi:hypothetical protein
MPGYSIVQLVIMAIVVAGVIGIGMVAIRASGVTIPDWAVRIFWIVVIVVFAVFAIKLLMSMV